MSSAYIASADQTAKETQAPVNAWQALTASVMVRWHRRRRAKYCERVMAALPDFIFHDFGLSRSHIPALVGAAIDYGLDPLQALESFSTLPPPTLSREHRR